MNMPRPALVLLLFLALPAFANITSSSLTGRVMINGAPAAGVTVTVTSNAMRAPRTTLTSTSGRYWFGALPPGVYDVTFSRAGHTSLTKRAVLELARVARVDGAVEPNPDEDSTTSTAKTVSVAEDIFASTHFDDRALDRLPTGRIGSAFLAPGYPFVGGFLDGVPAGALTSEETIEQMAILTGVSPVEFETYNGFNTAMLTRSGTEDFFFTLRDTYHSRSDEHFAEATAGGPIIPQRIWFFAGGWRGTEFDGEPVFAGVIGKIDAQLGDAHHLDVSYIDGDNDLIDSDVASLRYTASVGPRFTSHVSAADDFVSGRASYNLGDHVVTAGIASGGGLGPNYGSVYASNRWSTSRWNVYAGLRFDDGELGEHLSPRVGVAYDLRGNGAQAIVATWGEYAAASQPQQALNVATLGFASAIGNSGRVRGDVIRRESGNFWTHELQVDGRYRILDRFEAGGTYTLTNRYDFGGLPPFSADQVANVWLGAELPVGSHEFGVTLLQRYIEYSIRTTAPTDIALRYAMPFSRVRLLLAADATNVFLQGNTTFTPREIRFWLRVRL